jgi:hypothetical protein
MRKSNHKERSGNFRVPTVLENPGKSLNLLKKIQAWKVLGN